MKTTGNLLVAGILAALCCAVGNAQIVYSNAFNLGTGNIQGTGPNVANNFAGGSSAAVWHDGLGANDTGFMSASGVNNTTLDDAWTLPFTPQSGYIYTLSATVDFTASLSSWIGIGFAQNWSQGRPVGHGGFKDGSTGDPNGYDFIILGEGNGNVQAFGGPHATSNVYNKTPTFTAGVGIHTVGVVLDTSGSLWSIGFSIDGNPLLLNSGSNSWTYASNPTIGAVGITQNTLTTSQNYQWSDLSLTAQVVPEPSVPVMTGAGFMILFLVTLRQKRRRQMTGEALL